MYDSQIISDVRLGGTVSYSMYCKGKKHGNNNGVCPSCDELSEYADKRIGRCPLLGTKSFSSSGTVHCTDTGMLYHSPSLALVHLLHGKRQG